ncbi:hypothetical protein Tco_1453307 [Tanacetum coccineum]
MHLISSRMKQELVEKYLSTWLAGVVHLHHRRSWSEGSMVALKSPVSHGSSPSCALSEVAQIAIKDAQPERSKS